MTETQKNDKEVPVNIRTFRKSDANAVVQLWRECGLVVPQNDPVRDIERKMRVNPEWFLVGEVDGLVAATCMVGYEGHRGWINYLAVRPDLQKRGLGRRMMERAEALMNQAGCSKINLQIRSANRDVVGFYRSMGYRVDDVVSMGKRLDPDLPFDAE